MYRFGLGLGALRFCVFDGAFELLSRCFRPETEVGLSLMQAIALDFNKNPLEGRGCSDDDGTVGVRLERDDLVYPCALRTLIYVAVAIAQASWQSQHRHMHRFAASRFGP